MTLNWRDGGKAPFKMFRGAAVVDGGVAYFMHCNGEVCSYNVYSKKWSKLPKCPYHYSSLAVINGQVTAIGGCKDFFNMDTHSNKLLSLPGYTEVFPAMPTKRRSTAAVTSREHLIVAGGGGTTGLLNKINIVEVMDTKTLVWSTVASLPHPYADASGTICGDQLYMLGGWDDKDKTKSVPTCSLTELLLLSSSSSIWHRVADAPAYLSTCAAVNGELLAVGGCDKDDKPSSAIHKYNPTTNSWDLINYMPTARYDCLVVVLQTNEMMVVGGGIGVRNIDKIEIANYIVS
jgi:N-acetylneuraminic acid mutarotase